MTLTYTHVRAGMIGWMAGMLVYMIFCTGCAVPLPVKRAYVNTWHTFNPPPAATNAPAAP